MLTEDQARELLARAAATIDVPASQPVPTAVSWRRRLLMPAVAAAAAVAIVGAGVALMPDGSPSDSAVDAKSAGASATPAEGGRLITSTPTPPAGTRWVGWNRVVVAVPEKWTTGETRCFAPVKDTVYFDMGGIADCSDAPTAAQVQQVSALAVMDGTTGIGEYAVRTMRPVATVDGREVVERDDCERRFEGVCRRLFAVPSEGVVFAVTIAAEGDRSYQEIRDSVRILPSSQTVVPLATTDGWTPAWGAEPDATQSLADAIEKPAFGSRSRSVWTSACATPGCEPTYLPAVSWKSSRNSAAL